MKVIVVCLFFASLCSFGMVAVAEKQYSLNSMAYGESLSHLILNEQVTFSGPVFRSAGGISINTQRGTFLLKGTTGDVLVGKNVRVSGVVRGKSIFAVSVTSES